MKYLAAAFLWLVGAENLKLNLHFLPYMDI